jgi:hypothetical protein
MNDRDSVHPPAVSGRRTAEQRDELAPSQLIEWHPIPTSRDRELAGISQEVTERFTACSVVARTGNSPLCVRFAPTAIELMSRSETLGRANADSRGE